MVFFRYSAAVTLDAINRVLLLFASIYDMVYLRPVPVMHKMISLFASDEFNVRYPCPVVRYL